MNSEVEVKTRYLDLFVNYAFKRMFSIDRSKPYLIDLLNAILQLKHPIVDLTFIEREQLGLTTYDRKAVFDVFCTDQAGRRFIIELQHIFQRHFRDRSLYYSTFPIQVQAVKGDWNFAVPEDLAGDDGAYDTHLLLLVLLAMAARLGEAMAVINDTRREMARFTPD